MMSSRLAAVAAVFVLCLVFVSSPPVEAQAIEIVYSFTPDDPVQGWAPVELIAGGEGRLYGATQFGGAQCLWGFSTDCGVLFEMEPPAPPRWIQDLGYSYLGAQTVGLTWLEGQLYATESDVLNAGRAFRLTPTEIAPWERQILRIFASADGMGPRSPMLPAADGRLYGTTFGGGENGRGVVYRMWPDGSGYEVVHALTGKDNGYYKIQGTGAAPLGALVQGADGHIYGTAWQGGTYVWGPGDGTIFRFRSDTEEVERVHAFEDATGGYAPEAGLTRGPEGRLFGTTPRGYAVPNTGYGTGRIFEVVVGPEVGATAVIVELHEFTATGDGRFPKGELFWAADGYLYGATAAGGSDNLGTVFRIRPDGTSYEIVHEFAGGPADGARPNSPRALGPDGALYGVATQGGPDNRGVIYRIPLPKAQITGLIEKIEGLVDNGTLNRGQGWSLIVKLEKALVALDSGDTEGAVARLTAFINQVNAFVHARILDPEEAEEMILAAESLIASIAG